MFAPHNSSRYDELESVCQHRHPRLPLAHRMRNLPFGVCFRSRLQQGRATSTEQPYLLLRAAGQSRSCKGLSAYEGQMTLGAWPLSAAESLLRARRLSGQAAGCRSCQAPDRPSGRAAGFGARPRLPRRRGARARRRLLQDIQAAFSPGLQGPPFLPWPIFRLPRCPAPVVSRTSTAGKHTSATGCRQRGLAARLLGCNCRGQLVARRTVWCQLYCNVTRGADTCARCGAGGAGLAGHGVKVVQVDHAQRSKRVLAEAAVLASVEQVPPAGGAARQPSALGRRSAGLPRERDVRPRRGGGACAPGARGPSGAKGSAVRRACARRDAAC